MVYHKKFPDYALSTVMINGPLGTLAFILLFVANSVSRFVANSWIEKINSKLKKKRVFLAICKSWKRESGNEMRRMMGTCGIRVGIQRIRVGTWGIRVEM